MTEIKMQRQWADSSDIWETDPLDGNGQPILYWWEDMRPAEVRGLVQEVYARGYSRGIKDWQPHESPGRTEYVARVEEELKISGEVLVRWRKALEEILNIARSRDDSTELDQITVACLKALEKK